MKKIISYFLFLISYLFISPVLAFAQEVNVCPTNQFQILCDFNSGNFGKIIGAAINIVFVIAVIIAVVYLIYGGIKWIMSGGDKQAVETARAHIVASVVGLIVVFLAYFIINVVIGFFVPDVNLNNLKLPSLSGQVTTKQDAGGTCNSASQCTSGKCLNNKCQ